ncbi:MAG TPA: mannose-1-phosphate guanylyltransferase [Polyangiaceae bacterium]
MSHAFAMILAGGSGTRFWPASRALRPKQVLALGGSELPLIAQTARRIEALCPAERAVVATGRALVEVTQQALPWFAPDAFLAEPVARNTAACIGWASSLIHRRDPEAVIAALPSDHLIADEAAFRGAVEQAFAVAEDGTIVTLGIKPDRPETGYGYIEAGSALSRGVHKVQRFVEKPDRAKAEEYLASGRYFWNSGMFFFRADAMLRAIQKHMPALASGLERIERAAERGAETERRETKQVFEALESVSIDYGIMERVEKLAVIPADIGWSDLGSWHSVWELGGKDARGNAGKALTVFVDGDRNLVEDLRSPGATPRVVALCGVSDLCVVQTDDALLIIPRERAQDVRKIVEELKRRGGPV